jgi:glucuronosyltransferase
MNLKTIFLVVLFTLGQLCFRGEAAKIFFMIPLTSISEKQIYKTLIDALAQRGHEVVVASITKSSYKSKNIREFVPTTYEETFGDEWSDPVESRKAMGRYSSLSLSDYGFVTDACERVFQNPEFQQVLTEKFDLVFRNLFFGSCFNGALYRLQAPFIILSTLIPFTEAYELTGARLPASFIPVPMGPPKSSKKMSFLERLENVLVDFHWTLFCKYDMYPGLDQVYRKYLGQDIPSSEEIHKNVSLVFSNSHFTLNAPAPILPDVIEIGGSQCVPPKPVPKDIDEFLSGAKDGFIFFSMGSVLKSKFFSESLQNTFLSAFSKLKQRVLWKFEAELDNLPPNVRIGKWLPQHDILAHPNIRLFISHGGALSSQEAIYNGVPIVAIPVFADQDSNALNAETKGYGVTLEVTEITEEKLLAAINKILDNPSYTSTAKTMSKYFKDQPIAPLDRAVYWTEYVIRHKGTRHLQSSARELNFIEYYCLDVIAFLVSLLSILLFLVISICRRGINSLRKLGSKDTDKKRQ